MSLVLAGISAGSQPATLVLAGISLAAAPAQLRIAGITVQQNPDPTIVQLFRKGIGVVTPHRKNTGAVIAHRKQSLQPLGVGGEWLLDFEDNFTELNTAIWTPLRGFNSGTYNTPFNPTIEDAAYAADHVAVVNNELVLSATATPTLGTNGTTYPYTSGVVNSEKGYTFRYGFAESRIAVPSHKAWWPAFWMCAPNHWPPEIDIAEFFNTPLDKLGATANTHWHDSGNVHRQAGPLPYGSDIQDLAYHTYGMLWTPSYIQVFFDGQAGPKITSGVPQEAMYFIYNLGLHKGKTPAPTVMKVDYLRVWKFA